MGQNEIQVEIITTLFDSNFQEEVGNIKYHWKYDEGSINGTHPVATLKFKKTKKYVQSFLLT